MKLMETAMHITTNIFYSPTERLQVGFSFGLLLISFFPSTGILFRVGFVVAERSGATLHTDILSYSYSHTQSIVSAKPRILLVSVHRM